MLPQDLERHVLEKHSTGYKNNSDGVKLLLIMMGFSIEIFLMA